ncbi:MAG TPA: hypothetical protein ENI90_06340 [Methylothermaceae bacterium]|nr:hypothetical protein [Methylothermaceae bacterium]
MNQQNRGLIFPLFSITSAGLVIVFWWLPQIAPWLASPWMGGVGLFAVLTACFLGWKRRLSTQRVYDLLLWGSLWIWLAYWSRLFSLEAPMFKAYPVFFVFIDVFTSYFVLGHSERWSTEEYYVLEAWARQWWFSEKLWAVVVVVSLLMTRHYLIYPLAVGLLTVRRALGRALEQVA